MYDFCFFVKRVELFFYKCYNLFSKPAGPLFYMPNSAGIFFMGAV